MPATFVVFYLVFRAGPWVVATSPASEKHRRYCQSNARLWSPGDAFSRSRGPFCVGAFEDFLASENRAGKIFTVPLIDFDPVAGRLLRRRYLRVSCLPAEPQPAGLGVVTNRFCRSSVFCGVGNTICGRSSQAMP